MTRFCLREYARSHGTHPRGRGVWAFMPADGMTAGDPDSWLFSPCMLFSDAKRWAQREAPGVSLFVVGP